MPDRAQRGVLALIPARSGSKGVPDKNVHHVGGYPMIAWTIRACLLSQCFERVVVSTDSPKYAEIAVAWGAEAPFLRPGHLATEDSEDYETIIHALDWLKDNAFDPLLLVHMRPTTPLRDPALIRQAIGAFDRATGSTALRSVHEMSESAYKTFEVESTGVLRAVGATTTATDAANTGRQQFPATYQANGYVDVLSVDFIRSTGNLHGDRVEPFVTPSVTEVDAIDDLNYLEYQLAADPSIVERMFG